MSRYNNGDGGSPLSRVHELAGRFLAGLAERPVRATASLEQLRAALGGPLAEGGMDGAGDRGSWPARPRGG